MKNQTHYCFALGIINLYDLLALKDPILSWFIFISSLFIAGASILPNILDIIPNTSAQYQGVQLAKHRFARRYRHPLTHSPWTFSYFFPLITLADYLSDSLWYSLVTGLILSWTSHLILDAFNSDGIPLGRTAIYSNHPVKHYTWPKSNKVRVLRFANVSFDNSKANTCIVRISGFLFSINFANLVINHFNPLITIIGGFICVNQ
ncbi:MAG: hypothetical protein EAX86_05770 [Candidatus Heimdallarchaeota archaeon]|nr:hypothetical protein [Candidatus Heimdallarchaeota archaeon]